MKKCNHITIARIAGKNEMVCFDILPKRIISLARLYWLRIGEPSKDEIEKHAKEFMKYKYCPKCGAKLDFSNVKALFEKE